MSDFYQCKDALLQDTQKTTKSTYNILKQKTDTQIQIPTQSIWQRAFTTHIQWPTLWRHTYASYNVGTKHDILYKVLHNCLPTRTRQKKNRDKGAQYDTKCKKCKKSDETTLHIFARCTYATEIWRAYKYIYELLLPETTFIYE